MLVFREVLYLHFELRKSYATIADICGVSKGGVHNIIQRFSASGLSWPLPDDCDDSALKLRLYTTAQGTCGETPDLDELRKECARPGVTLQLLWEEYLLRKLTA